MKRRQACHRRRRVATSGRSCSAALSDFFVRQAKSAQRRPDRRQRSRRDAALDKRVSNFGQRDALARGGQLAQQILVPGEQRLAVAADPCRHRAARFAHAAHQLDCRRRADLEPSRRGPRRTAFLDRSHKPPAQILGQGCRHHGLAA
jgi:hypothetical protein